MEEKKKIPFAREVKTELAGNEYSEEEKKYILSGFVRNGGIFSFGKNSYVELHTEIAAVAKLLFSAFKECYGIEGELQYQHVARFGRGLVYVLKITSPKLEEVLQDLEVLEDGFLRMIPKEGLHRRNLKGLLIGCFLANGSINNPSSSKTSYFLEMAFSDKNDAMAIKKKLDTFKDEKTMNFKYIKRREQHVLYLKKSDQISVFLSYVQATSAMFAFENARILKDDINTNNRWAICDSANYVKTTETAKRDIEDIQLVLKVTPLESLSEKEQAVIRCRLENDDMNYREIAENVTEQGIPISKSGVVHIMQNMRDKAKKLRGNP